MKKILFGLLFTLLSGLLFLYNSPKWSFHALQWIEQQRAGLSAHVVRVNDLEIHYYQGGPEGAPTVLLVHGFTANRDNWLRFARSLTPNYRVIALDLPGFGQSSSPDIWYDVSSQVERLEQFVQTLQIAPVHLLGNSMGGHIAALYSARYPNQIRSLALFNNSGVHAPKLSAMYSLVSAGKPNPLIITKPEEFEQMLKFAFAQPPFLPTPIKRYLAEQALPRQDHYARIFEQLRKRYTPLEPELPNISAPTLILWGDQDRILDVSSIEVMQPLLKNVRVVVMPDVGHLPMLEQPDQSAQHYLDFLTDL